LDKGDDMSEKITITREEQLSEWVKGNSLHNINTDECCPDFSCCRGKEFIADKPTRIEFQRAYLSKDEGKVNAMLMMFLSSALSSYKEKVYITGETQEGGLQ